MLQDKNKKISWDFMENNLSQENLYAAYSNYYLRSGDENRQLTTKEIERLLIKKQGYIYSWGAEVSDSSTKEKTGRKGGQKTTQKTTQETTQETTQKITQKILALIEQNPHVTRKNLSRLVGNITEDGIKYNLAVLVKAGKIKRVGPDKGGFWKVTKGKNETAF